MDLLWGARWERWVARGTPALLRGWGGTKTAQRERESEMWMEAKIERENMAL